MEREPKPENQDPILYFCLDGVKYALRQNAMSAEDAYNNLKKWFPDVEILPSEVYKPDR